MKRLTNSEFIQRIRKQHGDEIKILGEYRNKRTKVLVQHECGYVWEANPEPLWNGHGCPKCANNLHKDIAQIKAEVFKAVGDEYTVLGEYVNTHTPILFRHNVCGTEFKMSPKAFLHQGQRCPNERYEKSAKSNTLPLEEVRKRIRALVGSEYSIVGDYQGSSKKALFLHHKCGRIFKMKPDMFIGRGTRCPHCYLDQHRSKGEGVIVKYLKQKGVFFKEQYMISECRNLRPLWFDFAIFDRDGKLKFLLEYDGPHHFSPRFPNGWRNFQNIRTNDQVKNLYCKENDIPLLRIKYVRSANPNIFEEKIMNKLDQAFASIQYDNTEPSLGGNFQEGVTTRQSRLSI